jgi:uncharacterized protein
MNTERLHGAATPRGEPFDADDDNLRMEAGSPCVGVCVIDEATGLCAGCRRTLKEVAAWSSYSDPQRRRVMDDLNSRPAPAEAPPPSVVRQVPPSGY